MRRFRARLMRCAVAAIEARARSAGPRGQDRGKDQGPEAGCVSRGKRRRRPRRNCGRSIREDLLEGRICSAGVRFGVGNPLSAADMPFLIVLSPCLPDGSLLTLTLRSIAPRFSVG